MKSDSSQLEHIMYNYKPGVTGWVVATAHLPGTVVLPGDRVRFRALIDLENLFMLHSMPNKVQRETVIRILTTTLYPDKSDIIVSIFLQSVQ